MNLTVLTPFIVSSLVGCLLLISCEEDQNAASPTRADSLAAVEEFRNQLILENDTLCEISDSPELFQDVHGYLMYMNIDAPLFFLVGEFEQVPWYDRVPLDVCNVDLQSLGSFNLDSLHVVFSGKADPLDERADIESRMIYITDVSLASAEQPQQP